MKKTVSIRENGSKKVSYGCESESKVEQNHKHECNINTIMARVKKGHMVPFRSGDPLYGDFTEALDYHQSCDRIIEAKTQFMTLPAQLRSRFNNDPGQLIAYVNNPENLDQCVIEGLLPMPIGWVPPKEEQPVVEPVEAPVVDEDNG